VRTLKPLALTALTAPFSHEGKERLVIVVGAMVSFDGTVIDQEQTLWKVVSELPGASGALDELKPKLRGEALLSGFAFAKGGAPAPVVPVRMEVGPIAKEVWAIGDRWWELTGSTDPVPFTKMPLSYDRAFGGEGFLENPIGKGHVAFENQAGESVHPLPNLEVAKMLVTSPGDRPPVAGFAPIDPALPQRMKKLGTYDQKWFETRYPDMAEDFDPTYYNVAPEDQWIEGRWQGGERFSLQNVHADKPKIEGTVPELSARCLVTRKGAAERRASGRPDRRVPGSVDRRPPGSVDRRAPGSVDRRAPGSLDRRAPESGAFEDVKLECDTLWFVPHEERLIMLFRGVIEVVDDEASDVEDMLVALERRGAPRPIEHYREVRAKRLDKDRGALHALRDMDLVPANVGIAKSRALSERDELGKVKNLQRINLRRRAERELEAARARFAAAGVDPDQHLPKELPPELEAPEPHELPDLVETLSKQAETAQKEAEARRKESLAKLRDACERAGIDPDAVGGARGGPPAFRAEEQVARLKELAAKAKAAGIEAPAAFARIEEPAFVERLRQTETSVKEAYRRAAHDASPALPLEDAASARVRRQVVAALAANESLAGRDLTGANLGGIDFSGRDLTGAFLEKAKLAGCSFRGANVEGAVFVRADLKGADFSGARARGANFGEADLAKANLTGEIDLTAAVFVRAKLEEADLTGACLDKAQLSGVQAARAQFTNVKANGLLALKGEFRNADLRGASIAMSTMVGLDFSGADLTGAHFFRTSLVDATLEDAILRDVKLERVSLAKAERGSSFARSDLRGAILRGMHLRGVNLEEADLRDADLTGADLSAANLRGAKLEQARAVEARFINADLTEANASRADLMNALLGGAVVRGASFEEANLFRADAAKMKGDDKTDFTGANLKQVRILPNWGEPPKSPRNGHG
jgi:uncharacterized protein YjbI with pentapeptide repeats